MEHIFIRWLLFLNRTPAQACVGVCADGILLNFERTLLSQANQEVNTRPCEQLKSRQ